MAKILSTSELRSISRSVELISALIASETSRTSMARWSTSSLMFVLVANITATCRFHQRRDRHIPREQPIRQRCWSWRRWTESLCKGAPDSPLLGLQWFPSFQWDSQPSQRAGETRKAPRTRNVRLTIAHCDADFLCCKTWSSWRAQSCRSWFILDSSISAHSRCFRARRVHRHILYK